MSKETLRSILLDIGRKNNISITEKECLEIEIARCDRQIEYYKDLKRHLEAQLQHRRAQGI